MLLSFGFSRLRGFKEEILMPKEWQENVSNVLANNPSMNRFPKLRLCTKETFENHRGQVG